MSIINRILEEPPFRLLSYFAVKRLARAARTIDRWDAAERPNYFAGVLAGATQAIRENVTEVSVFEFGVAGGNGLVALQTCAELIERETGVRIRVFGFDTGEGLPELCGDYRDHPDQWRARDYEMDIPKLRQRLSSRTSLFLGEISRTLPTFIAASHPPAAFVACDVDLYSSTKDVLRLFTLPGKRMLRRVPMYFDDVDFIFNHRFAGELLAIDEFNQTQALVKIDKWRGIRKGRVFTDAHWLEKMFIAHDLEAISRSEAQRPPSTDCSLG